MTERFDKIDNVRLSDDETKVIILDQEKLPNAEEYLELDNAEDIYEVENCMESKGFVSVSNISRKL